MVKADLQFFACHRDAARHIQIGGENARIQVGHECAQQQDTVAFFDKSRDVVVPDGAFLEADIERMRFANDALA